MPETNPTRSTSRRALLGGVPAVLALGATATVPALAVEPNADAAIIRLADAILTGNAETVRLSDLGEELELTPENERRRAQLRAQIAPLVSKGWDMRARLYVLDVMGDGSAAVLRCEALGENTIRAWHDNPAYASHTVTRGWFEGAVLGQVAAVLRIVDSTLLEDMAATSA